MKNKAPHIKRIVIFCILAFLPLCVFTPLLDFAYGEKIFASDDPKVAAAAYSLGALCMFAPAVANILTRLITKEGFSQTYLGLNFSGNVKYYIASVVIKLAENFFSIFLIWQLFLENCRFSDIFCTDNADKRAATILLQLGVSVIIFFPAFGEEWGWRGYLMPKLEKVMGRPASIIVGGIIWGLWHAPLTISGHNFGTDYKFYPYLGIALMCLMCVLMNAFLTFITEKTKSIYPASLCHMVNNNLSAFVIFGIIASDKALIQFSQISAIKIFWVCIPSIAITGIASFILLMKYNVRNEHNQIEHKEK